MVSVIDNVALYYFFASFTNPWIYTVDQKLLYLNNVLLWEIIFYIGYTDIDIRKFCRYGWENLFQKSSVVKECRGENLVV